MGRVASSVDNTMTESFWSTMQHQLLERSHWNTESELTSAVFEWIESFRNQIRRYTWTGDLRPVESGSSTPPRSTQRDQFTKIVRGNGSASDGEVALLHFATPTCQGAKVAVKKTLSAAVTTRVAAVTIVGLGLSLGLTHAEVVGHSLSARLVSEAHAPTRRTASRISTRSPMAAKKETGDRVDKPWRPGMPQLGVDLLWYEDWPHLSQTQIAQTAHADLSYLVRLNANSLSINFPFYTASATSSSVYAGDRTPTPAQLAVVVEAARRMKFRVSIRPLLDEADLGANYWRGSIAPRNVAAWFASYESFLRPYLVMANTCKATTFIVGAELNSLAGASQWKHLLAQARKLFGGELAYSANWDAFHEGGPNPPADSIGVDTYFPVSAGNHASVRVLIGDWNTWWNTLPSDINQNATVIDEVGIAAVDGAYAVPYESGEASQPLRLSIQANWFRAACSIVKNRNLPGIYFWRLTFGGSLTVSNGPTSFVGRPAQQVIRNCFASLVSRE